MKYRLKPGTTKKLREQYYLIMLFGGVIWILMATLFYTDENPQTFLIYLTASFVLIPYLIVKKVKPYFQNLNMNVENAYFEVKNDQIAFNHFDNLKKFGREKIEFKISDIVHVKKAFRKDNTVNKITLTLKNKTKVIIEDFDSMENLIEMIFSESESVVNRTK